VDYGSAAPELGWPEGESGKANFLRLLGRGGSVAATIHFLPPLAPGQDRKALAAQSHEAVKTALLG
jgi:1-acyl-sn-glycerol-3-phosphate acyltransferase